MTNFEGGYMDPRDSMNMPPEILSGNESQQFKTLRALTILQFKKAVESREDASADTISIDGAEIHNVMMIGEIMSIDRQTAFTTYTINDGTGSVLVKKFADRDATNMNMANEEESFSVHTWVHVFGHHRPFGNETFINALFIRPMTDHNEITLHYARCIQQHLFFTKGPLPSEIRASGTVPTTPMPGSVQQSASQMTGSGHVNVKDAIRQLLERSSQMHIDGISSALAGSFAKEEIRKALDEMIGAGRVCPGNSEDSYQWCG